MYMLRNNLSYSGVSKEHVGWKVVYKAETGKKSIRELRTADGFCQRPTRRLLLPSYWVHSLFLSHTLIYIKKNTSSSFFYFFLSLSLIAILSITNYILGLWSRSISSTTRDRKDFSRLRWLWWRHFWNRNLYSVHRVYYYYLKKVRIY